MTVTRTRPSAASCGLDSSYARERSEPIGHTDAGRLDGDSGRALGAGDELVHRSIGDDASAVDDEQPRAGELHLGQYVRREENGALSSEMGNEMPDLDPLVGIEPFGRLVENEKVGTVENRRGKAHALAEPLRELADGPVEDGLEPRRGHRFVDRALARRAVEVAKAAHEVQVLRDQHFGVERVVFREVADPSLGLASSLFERNAVEPDGAGVGLDELGDHAHGGGFPRAVRPKESDHLTAIHLKGHLLHGFDAAEALRNPIENE